MDAIGKEGNDVFTLNRSDVEEKSLNSFQADILEPSSYVQLIQQINPQILITTAWTTTEGFWHSKRNYDYMRATIKLADIALSANVEHFIGLGSAAELDNALGMNDTEDAVVKPTTDYGMSKAETGLTISEIAKAHGKRLSWLRIYQAYGQYEKKSRLVPLAIEYLSNGRKIELQNASKVLDWIHTEDVADAVNFLLQNHISDHFLDVGTSKGTSVLEVVEMIATLLGTDRNLIEVSSQKLNQLVTPLVCSQESELFRAGWKPRYSLDQGLRSVIGS